MAIETMLLRCTCGGCGVEWFDTQQPEQQTSAAVQCEGVTRTRAGDG
jgi:phage terminase large subunit-like protein